MNKGIMSGMAPVKMKKGGSSSFPDLTGDGKVTQKDILKGRGIQGFAEGGEADSRLKLFGKDGILFDPSRPTDYLLAVPGVGAVALGARALTKAPAIIKAANAAFKSTGKAAKKKGFNVRDPKTGKILGDVAAGKATIVGSTKTGKAARLAGATYIGGKLIDSDGKEIEQNLQVPPFVPPLNGGGGDQEVPDTRNFIEKLKDLPGETYQRLQDDPDFRDRFLAGSMNMMRSTPGFVPTSGVTQFYDAYEAEGKQQSAQKLADATIAAKLKASQGSSIFDNVLEGTKDLGKIALLPTAVSEALFGGATELIATPQGALLMEVEPGTSVNGSMMTTLIQQLQSAGYSGTNLQAAIKATVQPNITE